MARSHAMRANDFRRIALGMGDAIEGAHMGHPDFRINGRIFATLSFDNTRGMVKLTPEQQADFMREHSQTFEPASGAWGRQGCTMVRLDSADESTVGEAMTLAWQDAASKPAAKKGTAKKRAAKRPATTRTAKTTGRSRKGK